MTTTTLDSPALPSQAPDLLRLTGAHREYLEDRAVAVTQHAILKVVAVLLAVLSVALTSAIVVVVTRYANVKPIVIRIDELGRANVSSYEAASTYQPREPELRHHLREFLQNYLSRDRATLARDYPKALPFLKSYMLGRLDQRESQKILDTFHTTPNADDLEVKVKNVVLSELSSQPFKAGITFERRAYMPGTRQVRGDVQTVTAQVTFDVIDKVPNWVREQNPLAIAITDISIFEPFQ